MTFLLFQLLKSLFVTLFKDGYRRVLNYVVFLFKLVELRGTKVRIWIKTPPYEKINFFVVLISLPTS